MGFRDNRMRGFRDNRMSSQQSSGLFSKKSSLQHQKLLNSDVNRLAEYYYNFIILQQGYSPPLGKGWT